MEYAAWRFEEHQYDTTPSENSDRDLNHISHFMWCNSAEKAVALKYDSGWNSQSSFFAEKEFPVDGVNTWSTLTKDEWTYLFNNRRMKNNGPRYTNNTNVITIEGSEYHGLFIYPDDYDLAIGDTSENRTWEKINDASIVFLPAAGYRVGNDGGKNVNYAGDYGHYWSASSYDIRAHNLHFLSGLVNPSHLNYRSQANSVRLVTECQSEPSAE